MEQAAVAPKNAVRGWVKVFRDPPFYLVGVLPFSLGTLLAVRDGSPMSWAIWALGSLAVTLIMAMTFLVNEYYDRETDALNTGYNRFTGGSRSLPMGLVEPQRVPIVAGVCAAIALVVGLVIQFVFKTGPLTLPLGALAALLGYAYSGPPFQLISRGWGEVLIGVSVGWLPSFIGYYLQGGLPEGGTLHFMSLPLVLTCMMLIVINEFPDYASDKATGKRNLGVRLGLERAAWVFTGLGIALIVSLALLAFTYFEGWRRYVFAAPLLLTLDMSTAIQFGAWKKRLTALCFATIILSLATMVLLLVVNW